MRLPPCVRDAAYLAACLRCGLSPQRLNSAPGASHQPAVPDAARREHGADGREGPEARGHRVLDTPSRGQRMPGRTELLTNSGCQAGSASERDPRAYRRAVGSRILRWTRPPLVSPCGWEGPHQAASVAVNGARWSWTRIAQFGVVVQPTRRDPQIERAEHDENSLRLRTCSTRSTFMCLAFSPGMTGCRQVHGCNQILLRSATALIVVVAWWLAKKEDFHGQLQPFVGGNGWKLGSEHITLDYEIRKLWGRWKGIHMGRSSGTMTTCLSYCLKQELMCVLSLSK
jgi:hypothetical protein